MHYDAQLCNCIALCICNHAIVLHYICVIVQLCCTMEASRQLGESCCRCKCPQSSATNSAMLQKNRIKPKQIQWDETLFNAVQRYILKAPVPKTPHKAVKV